MLSFKRVVGIDDQLCQFHMKQKQYYLLENVLPTKDYLLENMKIPEGFDNRYHYIYKIYYGENMIALLDYQLGYRFSMIHDDKCLWIGLFLVDENLQRKGFGQEIIGCIVNRYKNDYNRIQLACIEDNVKGLAFWKACGFKEIGSSMHQNLTVKVLERMI